MPKNLILCLASAVLGGVLAAVLWNLPTAGHRLAAQEPGSTIRLAPTAPPAGNPVPLAVTSPVSPDDELTPEERVNVAVYDAVNRSVVNIVTKIAATGLLAFESTEEGAGSGSVLDKRGHVLTNFHVIEGAKDIQVTLYDGSSYEARLVGSDVSSDVAVLHIDAPASLLVPVQLGNSAHLKVGQRVFAIGNPFGLERTLTTGIISSLNRSLPARNNRTIRSIIQTDAAINPGNSGGPLLDSHGRLVGMNTAIASRTGQNAGVGFAIPVNNIARVVPQLITSGHVIRPETGITRVYQTERGLYVATMATGGPAEQAGLRGFRLVRQRKRSGPITYDVETIDRSSADLIVGIDNVRTLTADAFLDAIEAHRPGEDVDLHIIRDGREQVVRLRLTAAES